MSTDTANCMCRVISVEVEREPRLRWDLSLQVCCAWPASPVNGVAIWPRDKVRITKPEDQIDSYASSEGHQRAWCKKCGGHVFHDVGPFGVVDVYASLVEDLEFKPALHLNYESTIMPMKDGLPKLKDFQSDFGGSGEIRPEVSSIHQRWLFALMSALDILMGKRSRMIASARLPK